MTTELTDRQVALQVAENALGSREKALELLYDDPEAVPADAIDAARKKMRLEAEAKARAEHEASPAGRLEKAQEVATQRGETKQRALLAAELLIAEGQASAEELEHLSDEETIELAGMKEETPDPNAYKAPVDTPTQAAARELRAKWFQLAPHQRVQKANEAGIDEATFKAIAADAAAQTDGNIWS